ncbi:MAG TPA: hypothetical protein VFS22_03300 [Flavisolibacter sp.]|nr:hypothetical protein [Flavisolibacter sp.]
MKTFYQRRKPASVTAIEKASEKILTEKMGLTRGEFREINDVYGVNASRLLELMQLSKYQFVFPGKVPGQCEPCKTVVRGNRFLRM